MERRVSTAASSFYLPIRLFTKYVYNHTREKILETFGKKRAIVKEEEKIVWRI